MMLRIATLSLALLVVGSAVSFGQQQQPPVGQPQIQPGKATPGQPNANVNANAQARTNANFQFGGISERPWFSDAGIRKELGLQDNQFNTMNERYGQLYRQYNSDLSGLRQQNLPANELRARQRDLQQRFNQEFSTGNNDYFPDETARNRYQQLHWQYQDLGAFSNPQIQQRLNLTPEQQVQIDKLQGDWSTRMNKYSDSPADQRTPDAFRKLQAERSQQLQGILNEQQLGNWRTLTGNPYDFSPDVYFSGSTTSRGKAAVSPGGATTDGAGTGGIGTSGTGGTGAGTNPQ